MAATEVSARDFIIAVESATPGTWIEIEGENSFKLNPSENEETADRTKFSSGGAYEQWVMQRGASIEVEGLRQSDDITGVQLPGQARCEVLGVAVAAASLGRIRFRHPLDTLWKIWTCTVSLGEQGGGNNDTESWKVTFTRSGATTTAAVS